jgi:hypothetical protein
LCREYDKKLEESKRWGPNGGAADDLQRAGAGNPHCFPYVTLLPLNKPSEGKNKSRRGKICCCDITVVVI